MLGYNLGKILKEYSFHFIKIKNWNIFVKTNVVYMCIKK
jgi:hypothetical protein